MEFLTPGYFLIALWSCWSAYWLFSARRAAPPLLRPSADISPSVMQFDEGDPAGFMLPLVLSYLILVITPILTEPLGTPWAIPIVVVGMSIAIWARVHLGTNWNGHLTIQRGHRLIRSGPYKFLRHPIYCGVWLALVGTSIFIGSVAFVVPPLALWAFAYKAKIEERQLTAFFPEYAEYKRSTYF